ncbi:MAG TPA: TonB-dependent receptor [Pseudoxanthomonas sp.]|nr:TonB-dependent receptor [Pseudoxanthomonas sp.]
MQPSRTNRPSAVAAFSAKTTLRPLALAISLAVASIPALAQETAAGAAGGDQEATTLNAVTVTGSHIRRVDAETASPVITIDRQQIEDSGKSTIGDLLQDLPAMAGFMPNVAMNSGFSHGRALVSLRNLGPQRTLVLVNGHRMAGPASSVSAAPGVDVNALPAAMVERIDVLTDGASSVYGSDAIAGVVNIILKDKYDGFAVTADYGASSHGDGNRRSVGVEWGKSWDRGSLILGLTHSSMNALYDADRSYAQKRLQYVNGRVAEMRGTGTTARLSDGTVWAPNSDIAPGAVTTDDFHEFVDGVDGYNSYYGQYLITPVERTNFAAHATFDFTPNVQGYLDAFWASSKTTSQLTAYGLFIPNAAQNYYNPFGEDLASYNMRSIGANTRVYKSAMYQTNIVGGLRGMVPDTSWQWEASAGYAKYKDTLVRTGFSVTSALNNAVGASFMDETGTLRCGTPGNVIANCTPINVFNPEDPATIAAIRATQMPVDLLDNSTMKFAEASVNGNLFALPAGDVQAAFGLVYRKNDFSQGTTSTVAAADEFGSCDYNDGCILNQGREESVKEAYAEFLIPLLKGAPMADTLNLNIGTRYSRYNAWGSTTNSKVAIEWRPISNLLVRATASQVFRAPALGDLYGSPYNGIMDPSEDYYDPCAGYTGGGNPAACVNVPTDGSFVNTSQVTVITSGSANVGFDIQPEKGRSYDVGFVYDPGWAEGLSVNMDWWKVELEDMINGTWYAEVLDKCYAGDNAFCGLIQRDANGQLVTISVPYAINTGKVDVRGIDLGMHYKLAQTRYGDFRLGLDATFMQQYRIAGVDHNYVGESSSQGNLPRWRGSANLSWDRGPWHASWNSRYIGNTTTSSPFEGYCDNTAADGSCVYFDVGSVVYHDLSVGRKIESLHLNLSGGINNVFDRKPPVFYGWTSSAANTDASTYDTMGRYLWVKARLEF